MVTLNFQHFKVIYHLILPLTNRMRMDFVEVSSTISYAIFEACLTGSHKRMLADTYKDAPSATPNTSAVVDSKKKNIRLNTKHEVQFRSR